MKFLNCILKKFGLVAIPIKPTQNDLHDICFKWNHSYSFSSGSNDERIIEGRKEFPFTFELTSQEKKSMMSKAEDAYRCIVENPRLYK